MLIKSLDEEVEESFANKEKMLNWEREFKKNCDDLSADGYQPYAAFPVDWYKDGGHTTVTTVRHCFRKVT